MSVNRSISTNSWLQCWAKKRTKKNVNIGWN